MQHGYVTVMSLVERLHRQFLELLKLELDDQGVRDINNVQGLMLFNIGDAEMSVGELMQRGCYLGSNVSYNVKKLVENGYLSQERSAQDRRLSYVRLTEKGNKLRQRLQEMHERHIASLNEAALTDEQLQSASTTLQRLERILDRFPEAGLATQPDPTAPTEHRQDLAAKLANKRR